MAKFLIASVLSLFFLVSCSSTKEFEVMETAIEREPLDLPNPKPLQLKPIQWFLITPENANAIFEELDTKNQDMVLFGLTDEGYEALSLNFAEIRKYIVLHRDVLEKYRDYYERTDSE